MITTYYSELIILFLQFRSYYKNLKKPYSKQNISKDSKQIFIS